MVTQGNKFEEPQDNVQEKISVHVIRGNVRKKKDIS